MSTVVRGEQTDFNGVSEAQIANTKCTSVEMTQVLRGGVIARHVIHSFVIHMKDRGRGLRQVQIIKKTTSVFNIGSERGGRDNFSVRRSA
ncbi:hypothetical protein AB1Y20_020988 [Prymnesium parvum]|uniref:Uncharacterized protein n=1 Tax=Prymnesium parvum TaxID=97485 RepID=A0AB34JIU2_PRYPA